jgi:hypothetical protein
LGNLAIIDRNHSGTVASRTDRVRTSKLEVGGSK